MFETCEFFSLDDFSHGALWEKKDPVWMALHRLEKYLRSFFPYKKEIAIPPNVFLENADQIAIGEGTILEPGVLIQGPCILGKGCVIRHGAYLRGGVICMDRCVVGHGSEIKHSILLEGAQIAHLDYVGDSIIGKGVNLGAGVKCANLRLDRREVFVQGASGKIPTGLKKFGCVIGDRTQIGCNTVINPGTLIGPDCISYPLLTLQGTVAALTRIKGKEVPLDLSPLGTAILERMRQ